MVCLKQNAMRGVMSGTYDSMTGLLAIRRIINDDRNANNANNIMRRIFECIIFNGGVFMVSPKIALLFDTKL